MTKSSHQWVQAYKKQNFFRPFAFPKSDELEKTRFLADFVEPFPKMNKKPCIFRSNAFGHMEKHERL
jgi:hypothetical protein